MATIVSLARSFGKLIPVGRELLERNGHCVVFPSDDDLPLNENKVVNLLRRQRADGVVVGAEPVTREILDGADTLRIIAKHGAGLDNIDVEYATRKGVAVVYTPDANVEAVAELTLGLIFSISRLIPCAYLSMKSGRWETFLGQEINRKVIGVLGTGKIGKAVISKLSGLNVKVVAHDLVQDQEVSRLPYVEYVDLRKLFTESDYLTIHVPLTSATRGLVSAEKLALMKPNSFIINTSRGEVIDEKALFDALKQKRIAGAAIDVWQTEPPRGLSAELASLDNVIPTPHMGAYTREALYRMGHECATGIVEFFEGRKPRNLANPEVWKDGDQE